jgi:fumarylacetoacetase
VLEAAGLIRGDEVSAVFAKPSLNAFMALGPKAWSQTRARISDNANLRMRALVPQNLAQMHMPIHVSGVTDFYSSKEHATHVGTMFRDRTNPLLPNWLHIPIGYNGRASTVVVSAAHAGG